MRILAINPGHNGSAAYLVDGELEWYMEEERLSRQKYDGNPFRGIEIAIQSGVDVLVLGGTSPEYPSLPWTGEDPYTAMVRKHNPNVETLVVGNNHHIGHVAGAFYNSGFEEAVAVIVDGSGTLSQPDPEERGKEPPQGITGYETETIVDCSYPAVFEKVHKWYGNRAGTTMPYKSEKQTFLDTVNITKAYEAVSDYLGFGFIEAGKTMGLAPYGKEDPNIPDFFTKTTGRGDKNWLMGVYPAGALINEAEVEYLRRERDPREWHSDPELVRDIDKNLAWKIQEESQKAVGDLIEMAVEQTGKKNVVIAGGYGLNCVANYYYKKRFPDLNIFVDPVSHDGGTAIGLAKLIWYSRNGDNTVRPMKSLYQGISNYSHDISDYTQETLTEMGLDEGLEVMEVTPADVAQLIADRNIVALYQGRSEAGPRALGNRSILYDPTDPNGKDHVNVVKGREWFRPFAGSMLQEHFEEWFETYGMEESPHMMYAMDFKLEKHGEVPAITHVDGTCRIQTVTKEQNEKYYEIIDEFRKITGVPIVFNTSFNLAGEPLVETPFEAVNTIVNSDIEYLYFAEQNKLIKFSRNFKREFEEDQRLAQLAKKEQNDALLEENSKQLENN